MKKIFLSSVVMAILVMGCKETEQTPELLDEGIPLAMADYRKQQVSNVVYDLSFEIPDSISTPIRSRLKLHLELNDLKQPLYLDFNADAALLHGLIVNGKTQEIEHQKEHLIISEGLQLGDNIIDIEFHAGELSLNRNEDFLYTLLVPDRASTLFPCFDQPNIKGKYVLFVSAPSDWKVLAGAPLESSHVDGDRIQYEFGESDPMSTYLFSFVAGKFETQTENPGLFNMEFLYRETDSAKVKSSVIPVFELHQKAIDFLKDYTQYDFPFQKLDFAAIPGFQYGGMEHVGAIQYRQSALFLDETATENQQLSRAKLIAHETAHMWFGDLVTMDWFNDVWMKEVFANFMADKIINPTFPDINHRLNFMNSHYRGAYGEDRTRGTNPIRQQLDNLKNAGSLYGGIIYNKAPIMMRQLEAAIGEKEFKEGIREYIAKYAYGNATWNDLVDILDQRTPKDLKKWSEVWVNQSSRPVLSESIIYQNNKITSFTLSQKAEDGSDKLWPQTFEVALVYPDSTYTLEVSITDKKTELNGAKGLSVPQAIIYNSNAFGYGVFPMQPDDVKIIPGLKDEVARGYAYLNMYENVLTGNLEVKKVMPVVLQGIQSETNELIHGLLCGQASGLFWGFLSPEEWEIVQPDMEQVLWKELTEGKHTSNFKKNIFNLWKGMAYSKKGKERLYRVWNKDMTIADLRLNQDDFTNMAMGLALFGHEVSDVILETAKEALTNQDKIKRFEFLRPALSSDVLVRNQFFESFRDTKNREKESWVLTACGYMHHPLRQQESITMVPLALDLLEDIQKTGDIFFPKRWLSTTVGQYQSGEALQMVEMYLESRPNLNPSLKGKLLQATDDLYRYQNLLGN